jgi:hypothetical protein
MAWTLEDELDELRWHWGDAYAINWLGSTWLAQRRDTGATLTADTPEALHERIKGDYTASPVPRDLGQRAT